MVPVEGFKPRPTVYKTVALPTELNRLGASGLGYQRGGAGARLKLFIQPEATVAVQGPPALTASSMLGQGGMVTATKQSGAPLSARN